MKNFLRALTLLAALAACRLALSEKPLLLEEPRKPNGPKPLLMADNSRCFVCHLNYSEEKLAVSHARANIGCEKCHGLSDDHCSDEAHLTAPEIMYPRPKIDEPCIKCHPKEKLTGDVAHDPILAGNPKQVCTDCHGKHRLARRTRVWDRATGTLLEPRGE